MYHAHALGCFLVLLAVASMSSALGAEGADATAVPAGAAPVKKLRVGIIGLDTSHCVAFTSLIRSAKGDDPAAALQVVAAYPGGSDDIAVSRDRVAGYTSKLQEWDVAIVPSVAALVEQVDVVLLESVDGRKHLEQVRPVFEARKPVFIDKPVAGSLADAIEIYRLAEAAGVPCFSSSSLRYTASLQNLDHNDKLGQVVGCSVHAPCSLEPTHPDLYWYGVHGCEMIYTIMGPGCVTVQRTHTSGADVVTGVWGDGRVATFRGIRAGKADYSGFIYGTKANETIGPYSGYAPLMAQIAIFFQTGRPPVSAAETIELFAFMEAADESRRRGGAPVSLEEVLAQARKQNAERSRL